MNRTEFLELFDAGLSDCGVDAESRVPFVSHSKEVLDLIDEDVFSDRGYTAVDAHKLASAVSIVGNSAVDEFFKLVLEPKLELPKIEVSQEFPLPEEIELDLSNEESEIPEEETVFEPDQFFYEFASIDNEPEFVSSVIEDNAETVTGTHTFSASDEELHINAGKLRKIDKSRRSVAIDRNIKGSPLFWILFIVTIPLTLPVFAALWAVVGLIYASISAIMVAFVLVMIGIVAIGTALTLVGLIFGIYKIFSQFPIGLFEIGLAVAIGGATMLVSILIYNLVVRLMPKLFPFVSRLAVYIWTKIVDLYYFCKKGCGNK